MRRSFGLALVAAGCVAACMVAWYGDETGPDKTVARAPQSVQPQVQRAGPLEAPPAMIPPATQEGFAEAPAVAPPPPPVHKVRVFEAAPRIAVAQSPSAPTLPRDGATLAREIQRHLKRVGCYDGEAHGVWTPTVRRAMKAFTDHVNAALPVEGPDQVLLSMVEGHQRRACGTPCVAGQNAEADGLCVPSGAFPRSANLKPAAPVAPPVAAAGISAVPAAPTPASSISLEGKMALAGPDVPLQAIDDTKQRPQDLRRTDSRAADHERAKRRQRRAEKQKYPAWAVRAFSNVTQ